MTVDDGRTSRRVTPIFERGSFRDSPGRKRLHQGVQTLSDRRAQDNDVEMARPPGLEPGTCRLEGGCTIRLCYGR